MFVLTEKKVNENGRPHSVEEMVSLRRTREYEKVRESVVVLLNYV